MRVSAVPNLAGSSPPDAPPSALVCVSMPESKSPRTDGSGELTTLKGTGSSYGSRLGATGHRKGTLRWTRHFPLPCRVSGLPSDL